MHDDLPTKDEVEMLIYEESLMDNSGEYQNFWSKYRDKFMALAREFLKQKGAGGSK
jgi:hypothetical protein